jgi:hypothetical protein
VDDRFTTKKYMQLYPKEWSHMQVSNDPNEVKQTIQMFWKEED